MYGQTRIPHMLYEKQAALTGYLVSVPKYTSPANFHKDFMEITNKSVSLQDQFYKNYVSLII